MMDRSRLPVLAIFAVVLSLSPSSSPAVAEAGGVDVRVMTPRDVARIETVGEAAIRPDGSEIAYTLGVPRDLESMEEDGPAWTELHVVGFDGGGARPYVTGEVNVSHVRWSPDGDWIAYLAKRGDDSHTSVWAVPYGGGESVKVVEWKTDVRTFEWRPDGSAIAFIATAPVPEDLQALRDRGFDQEIYEEDDPARRVHVAELPRGPGVEPGEIRHLEQVSGHPYHLDWSPDGDWLLVDPAPSPLVDDRYMYRRLHVVDVETGETVARIDNPGKLGEFRFSPGGDAVALVSGIDIHDPLEGRLMWASLADGSVKTGDLRDLLPDLEGHVEEIEFLPDGRILYQASVGAGTRIGVVDPEGGATRILEHDRRLIFDGIGLDDSGGRLAAVIDTAAHPPELYSVEIVAESASGAGVRTEPDMDEDIDVVEPRRLTDSNPWLADVMLGEQEVVTWEGEGERVPAILMIHGGPESHRDNGWLTSYSQPAQVAAGRGYAVLFPNYRGSTGRGVEFAKADQGDGGGAEFRDVIAGADHLVERGLADGDRIGITGGSYGGYFTALGASRYSEHFAAGVMFVGISDQLSKGGTSDIPEEMKLVHWLTTPYEDLELFHDRSPVLFTEDARTPLLILHGKEDPRVNPGQSMEMYRALRMTTEVPVRLVFYPDEGHGNREAAHRYDFTLRLMRWFDHFLMEGGEEAPPWRLDYGLDADREER